MARPHKPTALHLIENTYRTDHHGRRMELPSEIPDCPRGLSRAERKAYRELIAKLAPTGMLTRLEQPILRQLAWATVRFEEASANVDKFGAVTPGSTGSLVVSPWARLAVTYYELMLKTSDRLGMNPVNRAKVSLERPGPKASPWDDFR